MHQWGLFLPSSLPFVLSISDVALKQSMFKECLSRDTSTGNEEMGKACLLGEASTSLDSELGGEESPSPIENFPFSHLLPFKIYYSIRH